MRTRLKSQPKRDSNEARIGGASGFPGEHSTSRTSGGATLGASRPLALRASTAFSEWGVRVIAGGVSARASFCRRAFNWFIELTSDGEIGLSQRDDLLLVHIVAATAVQHKIVYRVRRADWLINVPRHLGSVAHFMEERY